MSEKDLKQGSLLTDTLTIRSDETLQLRSNVRIEWRPIKDITTYELAKALDILLYMLSGGDTWTAERLIGEAPENVSRHFKIKPTQSTQTQE